MVTIIFTMARIPRALAILKRRIQRIIRFFGLRISFIDRKQVPEEHRFKWLQDLHINTIIDIGASKGKAAEEFHRLFPEAAIFSFEPLPDCFAHTQERMKHVPGFHAFNVALGDAPGTVMMHRSSYSGCSSLREMADLHKDLFPMTAGEQLVSVPVQTLDDALTGYDLVENIFVKMDVQGFEDKVIAGGPEILARARVVLIETSFRELYRGQPLFDDVYQLLKRHGFVYHGSWAPELKSPIDGALLQQDSIFIRHS